MRTVNRAAVSVLTTLPGFALQALQAGEPPKRLKLFAWGENDSTKGKFIVNDTTLAALPVNQRALGFETVALDFEHNTVPGSPEYLRTQEPRPVAGFGSIEVVKGEGLFLNAVEWRKPESRNEFKDLSPTVGTNASGEVTFVHSVALCRNGSVFDLTIETAAALSALLHKPTAPKDMQLTLAALAAMIGLPDTATQADVTKRFGELNALNTCVQALEDLKLSTLSATPGNLVALDARVKSLEGDIAARAAKEKEDLVLLFARNGKAPINAATGQPYTPEALKALSVPELNMLHANTVATIPLSSRTGHARVEGNGAIDKVSALNVAVAKYRKENGCDIDTAFAALRQSQPALFAQ